MELNLQETRITTSGGWRYIQETDSIISLNSFTKLGKYILNREIQFLLNCTDDLLRQANKTRAGSGSSDPIVEYLKEVETNLPTEWEWVAEDLYLFWYAIMIHSSEDDERCIILYTENVKEAHSLLKSAGFRFMLKNGYSIWDFEPGEIERVRKFLVRYAR